MPKQRKYWYLPLAVMMVLLSSSSPTHAQSSSTSPSPSTPLITPAQAIAMLDLGVVDGDITEDEANAAEAVINDGPPIWFWTVQPTTQPTKTGAWMYMPGNNQPPVSIAFPWFDLLPPPFYNGPGYYVWSTKAKTWIFIAVPVTIPVSAS